MADLKKITHVIFDLDGLLLDTETIYSECIGIIVARYKKVFTPFLKIQMMGRPRLESAKILIDGLELPLTPEDFTEELYSMLYERFPRASLLPGAIELVQHFHRNDIPIAIATGSHQHAYDVKMSTKSELVRCLSHAICSDNPLVKNGKPSPDIYLITASKFSPPPETMDKVIVFEDAPNGVQSAKAAGMNVIMVPDKIIDSKDTKLADRVLESLEHVHLEEWGLPPFMKN